MRPTLFLMLGYPGSGKSTFARQLAEAEGLSRISSDDIRPYMYAAEKAVRNPRNNPAVFGALDYVAEKLLAAGLSTIYDANFNRRKDREKHRLYAEKIGARTVVLWIKTPLETARRRETVRAAAGESLAIPPERYRQLVDSLQEPAAGEDVVAIDGLAPFEKQLQMFNGQLAELEARSTAEYR